MIHILRDGTVQLKGRPAEMMRIAIAGIQSMASDISDWECALADFIAEEARNDQIVDEASDRDVRVEWRNVEFTLDVGRIRPHRP